VGAGGTGPVSAEPSDWPHDAAVGPKARKSYFRPRPLPWRSEPFGSDSAQQRKGSSCDLERLGVSGRRNGSPALHGFFELNRSRIGDCPGIILRVCHHAPDFAHLHADVAGVIEREHQRFAKVAWRRATASPCSKYSCAFAGERRKKSGPPANNETPDKKEPKSDRFQIIVNAAQNLADNAVEYEPVLVPANREIYTDLAVSGLYSAAFASNLGRNSRG